LTPEPAETGLSDDAMIALAMILTKSDAKDRQEARATADAENVAAAQADAQRVNQLRDQADQDRNAAWFSGVAGMLGGAATVFSGIGPDSLRSGMKGAGEGLPHLGEILAGGAKANAQRDVAGAADSEAQSQAAIRRYNVALDEEHAAAESISKVQQFLSGVLQTRADELRAAASGIRS
jgi:hypothetical protein